MIKADSKVTFQPYILLFIYLFCIYLYFFTPCLLYAQGLFLVVLRGSYVVLEI